MFLEYKDNNTIFINNKLSTYELVILSVFTYFVLLSLRMSGVLIINDRTIVAIHLIPIIIAFIVNISVVYNFRESVNDIEYNNIICEYTYCSVIGDITIKQYVIIKQTIFILVSLSYIIGTLIIVIKYEELMKQFSLFLTIEIVNILFFFTNLNLCIFESVNTKKIQDNLLINENEIAQNSEEKYSLSLSITRNFIEDSSNFQVLVMIILIMINLVINIVFYDNEKRIQIISFSIILSLFIFACLICNKAVKYFKNNGNDSTISKIYRNIISHEIIGEFLCILTLLFYVLSVLIISSLVISDELSLVMFLPAYITGSVYIFVY